VPQALLGRPFYESDLRHELGLRPMHLADLISRDASAPTPDIGVRKSGDGHSSNSSGLSLPSTSRRTCGTKPARTLPAKCSSCLRSTRPGCIETVRTIAANHARRIGITHPVAAPGLYWIYRLARASLGFADGEDNRAVALPYLQF
jgi:hypothetical protein